MTRCNARPGVEQLEDRITPYVFSPDTRALAGAGSWDSSFARLEVKFPNSTTKSIGSGVFIGDHHVLTAGHMVYDASLGGYATSIVVQERRMYQGQVQTTQVAAAFWRAESPWIERRDYNYDLGLITLRPSDRVGWSIGSPLPLAAPTDAQLAARPTVMTTGFPGDLSLNGTRMYTASDRVAGYNAQTITSYVDIFNGQSGSPLMQPPQQIGPTTFASPVVWGVVSSGSRDGSFPNYMVRLNPGRLANIQAAMSQDERYYGTLPPEPPGQLTFNYNPPQPGGYNRGVVGTAPDPTVTAAAPVPLPETPPPDTTPPAVVVGQAAAQADPATSGDSILYYAQFSEPVSGFSPAGVTLSGPGAAGATVGVTDFGGHDLYAITVYGVTQPGAVTISVAAGVATDSAGNANTASTSTDATVTYAPELVIGPDTPSLPDAQVGVEYSYTLTASGQTSSYNFGIFGGYIPGMYITGAGHLAGAPTIPGVYTLTVGVIAVAGQTATRSYTITVRGTNDPTPTPTPTPVPTPTPIPTPAPVPLPGTSGTRSVVIGGATDGSTRLVSANGSATSVSPFGNTGAPTRTASADVDRDGIADVVAVTGPGTALRVAVLSGADGSVLVAPFDPFGGNFTGGGYVAAADLDGDGRAEFAVTPDQGGGPRVTIFSLTNGVPTVRANFLGIDDVNFRGGARAALGDVNHDGMPDVIVAAGFGGGPRTAIFTGPSVLAGSPVRLVADFFAFPGPDATNLRNGSFVASGDIDGDGFAELVFGGGPGGAPRVFILSGAMIAAGNVAGAQANPIANFFAGGDPTDRGGARVGVTNRDGDGKADLLVGSGANRPAKVKVYLGSTVGGGGEPGGAIDLDPFGGTVLTDGVYVS